MGDRRELQAMCGCLGQKAYAKCMSEVFLGGVNMSVLEVCGGDTFGNRGVTFSNKYVSGHPSRGTP